MALAQPLASRQPFPVPRAAPAGGRAPWLAPATLVGITLPPLLIAALRTPVGSIFTGYVVIARDAFVYQALWRQGWSGAWLFHSPYSAESLPGVLLYPWYLWPGHLLGWAAGAWLYQGLRVAAALALLGALWRLISELFRSVLLRRWALVLCVLGGGIGIFLPGGIRIGPLLISATEMRSPGSSVADLIAMAAHLPFAMGLMCWAMTVALRLRRQPRLSELIFGAVALLGLQLIYPQLSLLTVLVIGCWALLERHRWPLRFALLGAAVQAPYGGYLLWTWLTDPQALGAIKSSLDVGDPFGFLVLSHLVASGLIVLAILRKRLRGDLWLPALWIAGMTLFMFVPGISGILGRTFMASSIPFGLCATPGLLSLLRSLRTRRWRRRVAALTLAASSVYGLFSLAQPYWIAYFRLDPHAEYESAAESRLLQRTGPFLSARDVVLTTYLDGLFVPAQTDARAFVGHPDMTIDAPAKASQANSYFESWDAGRRAAFLSANRITYVLSTDPVAIGRIGGDADLRLLVRTPDGALFRVLR
jgi:hypothetical protein